MRKDGMANQKQFAVGKRYTITGASKRVRKLKFLGTGTVSGQKILIFAFLRSTKRKN
jgi:hypothetical protein